MKIAKLDSAKRFADYLNANNVDLKFDASVENGIDSPLAQAAIIRSTNNKSFKIGNRFCILPMEGWDGDLDGCPTELTTRRWRNFGSSGAKLIWGGEAVAVRNDGRANPNQLMINDKNLHALEALRLSLVHSHVARFGSASDLMIGLQLTHSGRFSRPNNKNKLEPRTAYSHPILDKKFGVPQDAVMSDDDLRRLIDDFVEAAAAASKIGFDFVDVKHCHGYLGHELLSGYDRIGDFGGSFENRTKFLRGIVNGIQSRAPSLQIGVRLSVFDFVPFESGPDSIGIPAVDSPYKFAWGGDGSGLEYDLSEPKRFLELLKELGIRLLCTTAGCPYYNPHIQRPAAFPPTDGYQPPEDPLVGVARQINATAQLKKACPELLVVGSGYSYLQEWLPNVGQRYLRDGEVDFVGLGRMVLSYPGLPADILEGKTMARKQICRTFSDCTSAPRNGMVSGCYPLDSFYKKLPEFKKLAQVKKRHNDGQIN